jgi:hypothetical protein
VSDAAAPEGEGSGGRRGVSRRTFVIGAGIGAVVVAAGGVALVENGVVPGKARLDGRYWSRQTPAELAFIGQALRR